MTDSLDTITLKLGAQARMVAYLLTRKQHGKVKIKEFHDIKRIRDALLGECAIDMKTGLVDWQTGTVVFNSNEDFQTFVKAVEKGGGDDGEGVEFDLVDGAVELMAAIESERGRQYTLKKQREDPAPEAPVAAEA